jgi:hypothetical protein
MKKAYEAPKVIYTEKIEARAVACAKQPGNPGCATGPVTT